MNIGIDARILERRMTGVGRFLSNILKGLPAADKKNRYFLFSYNGINPDPSFFNSVATGPCRINEKIFSPLWLNLILPGHLKSHNIDVFFTPNNLTSLVKLSGTKSVIVIHDVFHKINSQYHSFIYRKYLDATFARSIKNSNLIVTISENSKNDIIRFYGVNPEKIKVIYQAADPIFHPEQLSPSEEESLRKTLGINGKFILYVGVLENRKNIHGIIQTADLLKKMKSDVKTVLIGKPGYGSEKLLAEIALRKDDIKYFSFIDDKTLPKLYNMADVFFFPSQYEGFGLPPLEAMQSGLPVVSSNTSSLGEVVGDGGIMHKPGDYELFAEDINRLVSDEKFHSLMREKALARAAGFTIEKEVKELVTLFEQLNCRV